MTIFKLYSKSILRVNTVTSNKDPGWIDDTDAADVIAW